MCGLFLFNKVENNDHPSCGEGADVASAMKALMRKGSIDAVRMGFEAKSFGRRMGLPWKAVLAAREVELKLRWGLWWRRSPPTLYHFDAVEPSILLVAVAWTQQGYFIGKI
ncbi:hypothetical protein ACFX12_032380 [Malus domestica]